MESIFNIFESREITERLRSRTPIPVKKSDLNINVKIRSKSDSFTKENYFSGYTCAGDSSRPNLTVMPSFKQSPRSPLQTLNLNLQPSSNKKPLGEKRYCHDSGAFQILHDFETKELLSSDENQCLCINVITPARSKENHIRLTSNHVKEENFTQEVCIGDMNSCSMYTSEADSVQANKITSISHDAEIVDALQEFSPTEMIGLPFWSKEEYFSMWDRNNMLTLDEMAASVWIYDNVKTSAFSPLSSPESREELIYDSGFSEELRRTSFTCILESPGDISAPWE